MQNGKMTILKNIGIAVVCLCVLSYTVFHISSLFSEQIDTIVVGPTTENTALTFDGMLFRDSEYISSGYSGAVDYIAKDGEKIANGDKIATVYERGNSSSVKESLAVLDEQIELLEMSVGDKPSISELTAIRESASSAYYSIMKQMALGSMSSVDSHFDKLLVALNSVAMLTDEDFNIKETLETLYATRSELLAAGGESEEISSKKSGYFYEDTDGYERVFTSQAALSLDADELITLVSSPGERQTVGENCIGKMSYDSVWYFAVCIDEEQAAYFEEGQSHNVEFVGGRGFSIPMSVKRVLASDKAYAVVFMTNVIPEGFGFERRQTVSLVVDSVSGIYVPMSAVYTDREGKIVYILNGSVVLKRRIEIIYTGEDYYIVSDGSDKESDVPYLTSNELLITRGSGLFDGRILG